MQPMPVNDEIANDRQAAQRFQGVVLIGERRDAGETRLTVKHDGATTTNATAAVVVESKILAVLVNIDHGLEGRHVLLERHLVCLVVACHVNGRIKLCNRYIHCPSPCSACDDVDKLAS